MRAAIHSASLRALEEDEQLRWFEYVRRLRDMTPIRFARSGSRGIERSGSAWSKKGREGFRSGRRVPTCLSDREVERTGNRWRESACENTARKRRRTSRLGIDFQRALLCTVNGVGGHFSRTPPP